MRLSSHSLCNRVQGKNRVLGLLLHTFTSVQMVNQSNALHVLRGLYRLLKTPRLSDELAAKASNRMGSLKFTRTNESTSFLMERYRSAATTVALSDTERERLQKLAEDYYLLKRDLVSRAELHALDAGADQILTPMETSRRAAARAGLQLPISYDAQNSQ
jgi:hypothetical protein